LQTGQPSAERIPPPSLTDIQTPI